MAKAKSAATNRDERADPQISADERQHMIAEAAYFRALARGFAGGDAVGDWLAAEQEVNQILSERTAPRRMRVVS